MPSDDLSLLREYARNNSEAAFTELVSRHVNLVYSVALRLVRDPHLAGEITQAVFIILARRADSLGDKTIVPGWLCRTARYASANALTLQRRRQQREQEAYMQSTLTGGGDASSPQIQEETWHQIAPLLDSAMEQLGQKDHDALVMRFFEGRNFREVGAALGASEDGAKMRVGRALKKLRKMFTKRGVTLSSVAIAGTLSANSVQAAPVALTKTVTAVVFAKGAVASGSTFALIKGTLKVIAWTKGKSAIAIGLGILLAVGATATASKRLWFSGDEIQFEAEGTVTYATTPDPRGSYTDIKHFVVTGRGKLWRIRTTTEKQERIGMGGPIKESVDLYYEMGFDGTNIYTMRQQDENKILSTVPANERDKWVFAEGRVEKVDSPPCNDIYHLYPVWLAYCSAPYFKNLKGDKAVSPAFATRDFLGEPVTRIQSPAKWKMYDQSFIKSVSWLSDGTYEAIMPDGKETIEKYAPPYDTPFVWGRFENLSWTNWNGISVPSSFKIVVYRPNYSSRIVARVDVSYTITGTLGKIRTINGFFPVPKLTTKTSVTDWRRQDRGSPGRYFTTNSWDYSDAIPQAR